MRFEVLGPLRVRRAERELDLGFPQQRALLGLLMVRAGRPVQVSEIVDVLWASRPPASAPNAVRRYVGALRRLLEPGLPPLGALAVVCRAAPVPTSWTRSRTRSICCGSASSPCGKRRSPPVGPRWRYGSSSGPSASGAGRVAMGLPASAREHALFRAGGARTRAHHPDGGRRGPAVRHGGPRAAEPAPGHRPRTPGRVPARPARDGAGVLRTAGRGPDGVRGGTVLAGSGVAGRPGRRAEPGPHPGPPSGGARVRAPGAPTGRDGAVRTGETPRRDPPSCRPASRPSPVGARNSRS